MSCGRILVPPLSELDYWTKWAVMVMIIQTRCMKSTTTPSRVFASQSESKEQITIT